MSVHDRLLWLDLEMTGLDPRTDWVLEIATLVTDGALNVIAEGPDLVIHHPDEVLEAMNEWCVTHHGASGLTARVKASTISTAEAEQLTLEFVKQHCPAGTTPLAGNSIHMDRSFLKLHMPTFEGYLHYRNVDVSTVKELARRWSPSVLETAPRKSEAHRARDDIFESITELKHYRDTFFVVPVAQG